MRLLPAWTRPLWLQRRLQRSSTVARPGHWPAAVKLIGTSSGTGRRCLKFGADCLARSGGPAGAGGCWSGPVLGLELERTILVTNGPRENHALLRTAPHCPGRVARHSQSGRCPARATVPALHSVPLARAGAAGALLGPRRGPQHIWISSRVIPFVRFDFGCGYPLPAPTRPRPFAAAPLPPLSACLPGPRSGDDLWCLWATATRGTPGPLHRGEGGAALLRRCAVRAGPCRA